MYEFISMMVDAQQGGQHQPFQRRSKSNASNNKSGSDNGNSDTCNSGLCNYDNNYYGDQTCLT